MAKGYWKIGLQHGPSNKMNGWGNLVRSANAAGRSVFAAASDVRPDDVQSNSINHGNFIATLDSNNQRFDFDRNYYATEEIARSAWKQNAVSRWALFKRELPTDLDPLITSVSIENEQRGWVGWKQENNPNPPEGSIPGFTGWADCEGWQAFYTALEILREPDYQYFAFAYSGGLPEIGAWEQPGMKAYLKLCQDYPDRLGVSLHEYSFNDDLFATVSWGNNPSEARGYHIFRFQYLHDACDRMGIARPRIQIKEFGWHERKLSPSHQQNKEQLYRAAEVYAQFPNIEGVAVWTAQNGWDDVNLQLQSLIPWMTEMYTKQSWDIQDMPPDPPKPPEDNMIKFVEMVYPRNCTYAEYVAYCEAAWREYQRSIGHSGAHAISVLTSLTAKPESYAIIFDPQRPEQQEQIAEFEKAGITQTSSPHYELRYVIDKETDPKPPAHFFYTAWPTDYRVITQRFGENPSNYIEFGLPGHEGIDIKCPFNAPYYAPADGIVTRISNTNSKGEESAYGWHIVIDHGNGYTTLLAHARHDFPVVVGERVEAGTAVAYSGDTGNSSGPHLHMTLKLEGVHLAGWPPGYIDPEPYLIPVYFVEPKEPLMSGHLWASSMNINDSIGVAKGNLNLRSIPSSGGNLLRVVSAGETAAITGQINNGYYPVNVHNPDVKQVIDMYPYFFVNSNNGFGDIFTLSNSWGEGPERTQIQTENDTTYVVKNNQWEKRILVGNAIFFLSDTSPGKGLYYTIQSDDGWIPRYWSVGDRFTRRELVVFYTKNDCRPTGDQTTSVTDLEFVTLHREWISNSGIKLNNVIEVAWHALGRVDERYFYAPNLGLVGWKKYDGKESWISELIPQGNQQNNKREIITCL